MLRSIRFSRVQLLCYGWRPAAISLGKIDQPHYQVEILVYPTYLRVACHCYKQWPMWSRESVVDMTDASVTTWSLKQPLCPAKSSLNLNDKFVHLITASAVLPSMFLRIWCLQHMRSQHKLVLTFLKPACMHFCKVLQFLHLQNHWRRQYSSVPSDVYHLSWTSSKCPRGPPKLIIARASTAGYL